MKHLRDLLRCTHVDDLVRVGREHDGGYVLPARLLRNEITLLSAGISHDWSFEEQYSRRGKVAQLIALDGSVGEITFIRRAYWAIRGLYPFEQIGSLSLSSRIANCATQLALAARFAVFFRHPRRHFVSAMLMGAATPSAESLSNLSRRCDPDLPVIAKLDIEGAEYEVLQTLPSLGRTVDAIVVEFHDVDERESELTEVLLSLLRSHSVVHVHGNNYSRFSSRLNLPDVLEITLLRSELLTLSERQSAPRRVFPVAGVDMPNWNQQPDHVFVL